MADLENMPKAMSYKGYTVRQSRNANDTYKYAIYRPETDDTYWVEDLNMATNYIDMFANDKAKDD